MSQYAEWIMEYEREKLGLDPKDKSRDEEIIKNLQSGVKISKSVHMTVRRSGYGNEPMEHR